MSDVDGTLDELPAAEPVKIEAEAKANQERRWPAVATAAGIGVAVGSAAIVAALMYANRAKKGGPPA